MTRRGLAELLAIVAPPACLACREPLGRAGDLLCAECLRSLPWLRGWRCPRCGLARHRRAGCPAARAAFARAWAPMAYEGAARALVQALKFRAALPAAGVMSAQLAATLPERPTQRRRGAGPAAAAPAAHAGLRPGGRARGGPRGAAGVAAEPRARAPRSGGAAGARRTGGAARGGTDRRRGGGRRWRGACCWWTTSTRRGPRWTRALPFWWPPALPRSWRSRMRGRCEALRVCVRPALREAGSAAPRDAGRARGMRGGRAGCGAGARDAGRVSLAMRAQIRPRSQLQTGPPLNARRTPTPGRRQAVAWTWRAPEADPALSR